VKACLGALSEEDRFGVVCFDNQVERVSASLLAGDKPGREKAAAFLRDIDAHGGTELAAGLRAATEILTGGGDILLLTDGQVMGTETIIGEAKAAGIRIHCLGIGSASQDRFLALLASQTGGLSRMVTPRERVDMAAMELFSTGGRPVACDVCIRARNLPGAKTAPHPADAVYAGTPLVVFGSTEGPAEGQLEISWKADSQPMSMVLPLTVPQGEPGEIVGLLQGARLITALDSEYLDGAEGAPGEKRRQSRIGRKLEALSRQFGLASRRMALVAVVQRKGDKAGEVPRTHVVPVGMPQDVQFYSYFTVGRPRGLQITGPQFMAGPPLPRAVVLSPADLCPPIPEYLDRHVEPARLVTTEDVLLELARRIEPDGGLPGESHEDRVLASLLAVLLFAQEGHTAGAGAFMPHVQRLLTFLKKADLSSFSAEQQALVAQVLNRLAQPGALRGPWLKLVRAYLNEGTLKRTDAWKQLGGSLK